MLSWLKPEGILITINGIGLEPEAWPGQPNHLTNWGLYAKNMFQFNRLLIGLYKNSGSASCVAINLLLIMTSAKYLHQRHCPCCWYT